MFCSGCGQAMVPGQVTCPQCGRQAAPSVPPVPNLEFQIQNYAGRVKALSIVWFIYGGLSLALGIIGLTFASQLLNGPFGPWAHGSWGHGPWAQGMLGPAIIHFAWVMVLLRSGLAFAAGWGLMDRAHWGRVVAIVVAFLSLLKFPIGTALGIWTLVTLLGYRNTTLYNQL